MESWWTDLKPVHLTQDLNKKAVAETKEYLKPFSFETVNQRDDILIKLIQMKAAAAQIP